MATQWQSGRSCTFALTQLAKAFSLSSALSLINFMQLVSLLFTFLSFLSPAQSYAPLASSQIYEQEETSITKPLIYETVAASSAGSLLMQANFPHNKEALLLGDGRDHVSKEAPTTATPAFIYESVAASFSLRPAPAEGSYLHDNALFHDAEAAILDDGGKHLPSIDRPSFIYESEAAALPQKAHATHGSTLLHDNSLPEENYFLLDEGIGKPIMKTEVAKPSYIHESVIAASIPSRPPSDGRILHNNVSQEENAFLLSYDTINTIMHKKEDAIIANPSFIYESVAASIHPEVHDTIRNNMPQENGLLLDDGGMHVDTVQKEAKPIKGKTFIYEYVAAQSHTVAHAAGDSLLHDNVSQEKNSSPLDDDGKQVREGSNEEKPINADPVAALSHLRSPRGSLLRDNVPQPNNVLLDNGGKHMHESTVDAVASTQDRGKVLQDNVPQERYDFFGDDGHQKPISSIYHDSNSRALLIHTKPKEKKSQSLHSIDIKVNVQDKSPAKAPASLLHNDVPQGKHAFLVDDGDIKHVEDDSPVSFSKEVDVLLCDNVAQEKHGSLVNDGGKHAQHKLFKSAKEEEHVLQDSASQGEYSYLLEDGGMRELPSKKLLKNKDDNIIKKLPIYHKLRLGKGSFKEENLRIVGDDSSKNMRIYKGPQPATIADHGNSNEANPRMVGDDYSIKMRGEEHGPVTDTGIGDPQKGNIKLVVGDSSNMNHEGAIVNENPRIVGNSTNNMIDDIKGNSSEESLRIVVVGDSSSKTVHGVEGNPPNENLKIQKGSEAEGYPVKDENLRMVVGVSSNSVIQTGYEVQGSRSNENLRMVVGDSSKSMVQEGYGSPPKLEDNLRMVIDDTSNIIKNGPFHARGGRSRLCTSNPGVCLQLAHAEHMNHIALYGLPPTPDTNPACCGILCVDLNTDQLNCGSCGTACVLSETCCNGSCTDLNKDSSNCGQCGNTCSSFYSCQYGMCGYY